jgi:hypothetical protein
LDEVSARGFLVQSDAADVHGSGIRARQTFEHIDSRGLARTARAEEPEQLSPCCTANDIPITA